MPEEITTILWGWLFSVIFSVSPVRFPRVLEQSSNQWKKNQAEVIFSKVEKSTEMF